MNFQIKLFLIKVDMQESLAEPVMILGGRKIVTNKK